MSEHTTGDAATKVAPVLSWVEEVIGRDLLRAEEILQEELASSNPYVSDILQHATRFRGKRFRPMLRLLAREA